MTHTANAPTRQRWMFLAVLLTIAALILSACGAKIETQLGLESAEKGTRTMQVSFNLKDNKDKIKGGSEALDTSIRKHLPSGLEYGGIQSDGDKARATLTIPFSSVEEYRTKVASILKAAGSDIDPQISIINSEQGLVKGIQVKENFTSKNLLGWVPEALVVDGVVSSSDKNNVFTSDGDTTVKLGDKTVKNSGGSTISAKDVQDRGFKSVQVDVEEKNDGYKVMVSFVAQEIMNSETSSAVDAYLNQVKPEGSELKKGLESSQAKAYAPSASTASAKEEVGRTLTFSASSIEDLGSGLKKLFGASSTDFSASREVVAKDNNFTVQKKISGLLDCSLLCSPNGDGLTLTIVDSNDKSYMVDPEGRASSSRSGGSNTLIAVDRVSSRQIEMKSMKVATSLGLDGSMEARFLYAFPTEDVAGAEQKLKDVFAGGGDDETEVRQDSDSTIVSVKVRGKDQNEFNQRLNAYLPDSKVTVTRPGGYHPFGSDYTVTPEIKLSSKLGNYYSAPFEFTFKAPTFSSLDQQKVDAANSLAKNSQHVQLTVNGGELSVKTDRGVSTTSGLTVPASGLSLTDVIVDAVIVGLLLLILVLLFLFRKKIAAARAKGRERRAASAAALGAAAGVATGYGATQADAQNGYPAQGGYAAQPGYQAQGGYPAQNTAYTAGDDSPTQVFTPQHGLNYGENEPTKAMPAYDAQAAQTVQLAQPVQPTQPTQPGQTAQQPVQPNQFGADDGDVLQ
ncbi:flagellar motor protein [uncultured Rothia sp.]|uniref:flagellar motor protein n=1 Tax=uncultured Rothia sp. TaxID=316088 RepID=UPI00288B4848|nr:flagellar motor protein [uncultured Rothia sp.]